MLLVTALATLSVVLIATVVLLLQSLRRRKKGKVVCLIGLSNSGKTLLFYRILHHNYVRTQNSMKENKSEYQVSKQHGQYVQLVDIPGDERLRARLFKQHRSSLLAVIWVVDSVNFPKELQELAHLAVDLFTDPTIIKGKVPFLVACNKQDLMLARGCDEIKQKLEDEISQVEISHAAKLGGHTDAKDAQLDLVKCTDGKFKFSSLPNKIQFLHCSARGKGLEESCVAEVDGIKQWIEQL